MSDIPTTFQVKVVEWMLACFGIKISRDKAERNHRFFEEACELVQAGGCSKEECLQLVDYVFNRPAGVLEQEVGGVTVTLAALCFANEISMNQCAESELGRNLNKIEKIRAKQAAKPQFSPLPEEVRINNQREFIVNLKNDIKAKEIKIAQQMEEIFRIKYPSEK